MSFSREALYKINKLSKSRALQIAPSPVRKDLRHWNQATRPDVVESSNLTGKHARRIFLAEECTFARKRGAEDPLDPVVKGDDNGPVQAAGEWWLRYIASAWPASKRACQREKGIEIECRVLENFGSGHLT